MDTGLIVLRLVHILLGVYWAGTILFFATFLEPSLRDVGPDGAKVMQALARRGYLNAMPVVALLTILTGIDLLRRVSEGFDPAWFGTATGSVLSAASLAAILAFAIGVLVLRPAALAIGRLSQAMGQAADGGARESLQTQIGGLRGRMTTAGRLVASLLGLAVVGMAVGRYLP
jgi:hypothetical protein